MYVQFAIFVLPAIVAAKLPIGIQINRSIDSNLANIHIDHSTAIEGAIQYTYGSCDDISPNNNHQVAFAPGQGHDRLVWKIPGATQPGGCISAWNDGLGLVGRSDRVTFREKAKRTVVPMDNSSHIDSEGPWFNGVELLSQTDGSVNSTAAKAKDIAIVGAGMAGLMTWLCLHQAGMENVNIVEASQRFGGRLHTEYFGDPSDRLYQEMGAMRFPRSITDPQTNTTLDINDQKLVFDLAAELNTLNGGVNNNFSINFIEWIQSSQAGLQCAGGVRKPNGQCPTLADIAANSSLAPPKTPLSSDAQQLEGIVEGLAFDSNSVKSIATNMFQAHKQWLDTGLNGTGGDQWSEFDYMHNYLKYSLNATDEVLNAVLGGESGTFWDLIYEGTYFQATNWRTVDGGLSRIPEAFHPLVDNVTSLNRKIAKIAYDEDSKKVSLFWHPNRDVSQPLQNASYDYAITAVPLAIMRMWELPNFSLTKSDAIQSYGYVAVCKVALKYRTRFWEHFDQPIYGSCSTTTDIKGIGSICYPSYDINSTGPGVMLASYTDNDSGLRWASIPEQQHAQYVANAMADVHGDVARQQWTGEYKRKCWILDEFETVSWGSASVGQRQLYIPEFFKTEKGVIMSGEGTSYTSAWTTAALESGIRASVQLLLELGLVDEAKHTVEKWMARWITV